MPAPPPVTEELKGAGATAKDLAAAGFGADELRPAGFTAAQLKAAGFNCEKLRGAGFSAKDLEIVGFSAVQVRAFSPLLNSRTHSYRTRSATFPPPCCRYTSAVIHCFCPH